jgi:hypothetical protein
LGVQGAAAPGNWLVTCLVASIFTIGAGFVCVYRTTETLAVFTLHGRARLLEYTGTFGFVALQINLDKMPWLTRETFTAQAASFSRC